MSDKRRVQGQLSERSATLADPSRLMRQAFDRLADLENATAALGDALVAAGLPQRAWRSEQATLRLLSEELPAITFGAFLARLEDFATRTGPVWLRGTHDDVEAFHAEVGVLSRVARPLLGAVRRLQRTPFLGRRGNTDPANFLQLALRQPRLQAPLTAIVEILSEFEASAAHEVASPAATLRARAAALAARVFPTRGSIPTLPVGLVGLRQRLSLPGRWPRGWRLAASTVLAFALVIVGTLLILSHRAPAPSLTPAFSSHSSPATSPTAPATGTPTPASTATAGPAPKLALSCTLQGTTATLTLKNVGTSSFTWQVQPPPTLTAAPAQGALDAGQSAVVQVSAKTKKTPTGTIRVVANHGNLSTEDRVSCG